MKTTLNLLAAGMFLGALGIGFGQSTLQFTASTYTVAERSGAVTLAVQRAGDTNTPASVDYATTDGTATNGLKYTAVGGTLAFGAGEINQTILVEILNDGFVGGTKTFQVVLSDPTNAVLGTRTTATVSITDNDVGVQFQFATYTVAEDGGAVVIGVVRGDDANLPVTVDFTTTDLTATSGFDYTGVTTTLAFAATERLKLVPVPILNDSLKEANETFRITLSNPTGATRGSTKTTTVTIVDNDGGFQLGSTSYSVAEDAGTVLITLTRGDETNLPASVDYATSDLTAVNGLDYTGATNTLWFAPGERAKVVSVPILNDGITEPTKTFRASLSNPTGGVGLGSRTTTTVSILDNDPGLGFESGSYSVWEGASGINVVVLRGNDWALGPITVDYVTSDVTAEAGEDYQALSGTLEFKENETVKSLSIPIFRDALVEGGQTFQVTLSNPTGGATLGRAMTGVMIQDNSFTVVPAFNSMLAIRREGEINILNWTPGGQLQRADRVTGPWQTLTATQGPYTIQSSLPRTFFRVEHPRPVNLYVPSAYDGHTPMPLVVLLHMLGGSGQEVRDYLSLGPLAERRGFLFCYPDGTMNQHPARFWNATDACCDFWNAGVDDAGYLRGVIEAITQRFAVDRKRIYFVGQLNGGFMAYRMACQFAGCVAGIATLNGLTSREVSRCAPSEPVNILHLHTTDDPFVPYGGGILSLPTFPANMPPFPGAVESVRMWAVYNGASGPVTDAAPSLDLVQDVPGLETVVTRYTNHPSGGAVELWTINGGGHIPALSAEFSPRVIDWLLAHPKP